MEPSDCRVPLAVPVPSADAFSDELSVMDIPDSANKATNPDVPPVAAADRVEFWTSIESLAAIMKPADPFPVDSARTSAPLEISKAPDTAPPRKLMKMLPPLPGPDDEEASVPPDMLTSSAEIMMSPARMAPDVDEVKVLSVMLTTPVPGVAVVVAVTEIRPPAGIPRLLLAVAVERAELTMSTVFASIVMVPDAPPAVP